MGNMSTFIDLAEVSLIKLKQLLYRVEVSRTSKRNDLSSKRHDLSSKRHDLSSKRHDLSYQAILFYFSDSVITS